MNVVKPLRQLLVLRRRRQERFDAEVREQVKRTKEAEREAESAQTHEADCAHLEQLAASKRQQLTERSFAPADLITAEFAVKAAQAVTQAAVASRTKADAVVEAQQSTLLACRQQVARNSKRIDDLNVRLAKALREREEREEDADAEESEETAGARIAARRRAREAAQGV
jgi:predicted GNAT family acetyltransferase